MSFERLADAIETIRAAIAELDVDVVSPAEAAGLVSSFAEVERLCAGARTVLARSAVDAEEVWRPTGATSGVDWLARRLGCTRQGARHVVDRSNHLGRFEKSRRAACRGRLSEAQLAQVLSGASAVPAAEDELLEAAQVETLGGLRRRVREVKANAQSAQARKAKERRIHQRRSFTVTTDDDGARVGILRGPALAFAELEAILKPFLDDVFDQARREGRREPYEAYRFDALLAMARTAATGGGPSLLGRLGKVIVRLDGTALERGHTTGEEICEIDGLGPLPVTSVLDQMTGAFWAAAFFNGAQVARVAHLGRKPTAAQRTAIEARDRECQVLGCNNTIRTQIDHQADWAATWRTVVDDTDRLCCPHHDLKTRHDWRLEPGTGKRRLLPPDHPDHPGHPPKRRRPAAA